MMDSLLKTLAEHASLVEGAVKAILVFAVVVNTVPVLVWLERKACAWIQDRTGPNRTGYVPFGLAQPVIDVVKFFFKEELIPANAHKVLFILAPCIELLTVSLAFAVIPFGDTLTLPGTEYSVQLVVADIGVGVLWVFAMTGLGVYGIILAGWSSSNHYAFMGGLRSSAQIISYELGMSFAVVAVLMQSGSFRLRDVVFAQDGVFWNAWTMPFAFVIFGVCIFAETNRLPFDLPEAESELVAGYHVEYTAMKFALFFMAEYIAMVSMSALLVTLFLGGWRMPGLYGILGALGFDAAEPRHFIYGLMDMSMFALKVFECCLSSSGCAGRCHVSAMIS